MVILALACLAYRMYVVSREPSDLPPSPAAEKAWTEESSGLGPVGKGKSFVLVAGCAGQVSPQASV